MWPTCLPAFIPACLPACLPTCLYSCLLACLKESCKLIGSLAAQSCFRSRKPNANKFEFWFQYDQRKPTNAMVTNKTNIVPFLSDLHINSEVGTGRFLSNFSCVVTYRKMTVRRLYNYNNRAMPGRRCKRSAGYRTVPGRFFTRMKLIFTCNGAYINIKIRHHYSKGC